jgi:hypothetical protein
MMKDEKHAQSFKFTKMSKREDFLPSIKSKGHFEEKKPLEAGEKYIDSK